MDRATFEALLHAVAEGRVGVNQALADWKPTEDVALDFATVDAGRGARMGSAEVVYGDGKSADQISQILQVLRDGGQLGIATRVSPEKAAVVVAQLGGDARYEATARVVLVGSLPPELGRVAVVSAGTSDEGVASEAAVVARALGCEVLRVVDVGVAGLHRVLKRVPELRRCAAVIVVAGMDGALPSVVGGLVGVPVLAVPTSVGYGAALGGISALLTMLNSCAPGVMVVNIDNGFGAGFAAARIVRTVAAAGKIP